MQNVANKRSTDIDQIFSSCVLSQGFHKRKELEQNGKMNAVHIDPPKNYERGAGYSNLHGAEIPGAPIARLTGVTDKSGDRIFVKENCGRFVGKSYHALRHISVDGLPAGRATDLSYQYTA